MHQSKSVSGIRGTELGNTVLISEHHVCKKWIFTHFLSFSFFTYMYPGKEILASISVLIAVFYFPQLARSASWIQC